MKKLIIVSLSLFSIATLFNACRKDDNPRIPQLTQVPVPVMVIDPSSDQFINPSNPASFKVKFVIQKLFDNDITPQKTDIVVMKNRNTGNVKVAKPGVGLPSTIEITGQDLINLF